MPFIHMFEQLPLHRFLAALKNLSTTRQLQAHYYNFGDMEHEMFYRLRWKLPAKSLSLELLTLIINSVWHMENKI